MLLEFLLPDGRPVQVDREAMVPLNEAIELFSNQIKNDPNNTFALNWPGSACFLAWAITPKR